MFNGLLNGNEKEYDKEIKTFESSQKTKSGKKKDDNLISKISNTNDKSTKKKIIFQI